MPQEIERKFLVASDAWRDGVSDAHRITQAYVMIEGDRSLRVRRTEGRPARMTLKIGSGLIRDEFEYEIPADDVDALFSRRIGNLIEKTRHRLPWGSLLFEIDVFEGALQGLVIAEIELPSAQARFDRPGWLGREVTGETAFENRSLAVDGLPASVQAPYPTPYEDAAR